MRWIRGKKKRRNQGVITVFVTLIMVPVVAITGVMVDVARLKMYSSQAAMAADSYGNAVLSEFDNLLKQLYGLFAVTQNKEGMEAVEKLADYASYSFNPNGDKKGLSGFMPYQDVEMKVTYEKINGASLSNNNVLMTQISDFMRYRIIQEVLEGAGILDSLERFDSLSAEMDVMEERTGITDSSAEILGKIDEYYQELKKLASYPSYLAGRQAAFDRYNSKLVEIVKTEAYENYVYYLKYKDEIEEAIKEFDGEEGDEIDDSEIDSETDDSEADSSEADDSEADEEEEKELAEKVALYDRFHDFDAEKYVKELKELFVPYANAAGNHDSDPIDFENANSIIDNLGKRADELEDALQTLKEQIARLESKLSGCSEEMQEKMQEEIAQLKEVLSIADEFRETYELIAVVKKDKEKNQDNREVMEEVVTALNKARDDILSGKAKVGEKPWPQSVPLVWYDFRDDKSAFYSQLQKLCGSESSGEGDKDAGEKEIDRANSAQEDAEKELDQDETTTARDISEHLASQLKNGGGSSGEVPGLTEYFSGGLSFDALSKAGSNVLDKFLVTTYDFGMFSSRVSGIRPEEESDSEESYADYSLTKIKMSPDVNYLYGAELEYLFGGYNKSVSNLNQTRNVICGVRLTMNFISTYQIKEINDAINAVANAAASAVASTGIGAAAAPLVRVAVSGALRLAVSTIETVADWNSLKERKDVVLLKKKLGQLESKEALEDFLGISIGDDSEEEALMLSYEDYLYVLLCLLVDENTLLSRTSDLITLNVNQAKNGGSVLNNLDFKMADTVTAIKSTCKVKADFVVLPDNFAKLYFSNTDTESLIEFLEGEYFGYSVIRGY